MTNTNWQAINALCRKADRIQRMWPTDAAARLSVLAMEQVYEGSEGCSLWVQQEIAAMARMLGQAIDERVSRVWGD